MIFSKYFVFFVFVLCNLIYCQEEPFLFEGDYVWIPGDQMGYENEDTLLFPGVQQVKIFDDWRPDRKLLKEITITNKKIAIWYSEVKIKTGKAILKVKQSYEFCDCDESNYSVEKMRYFNLNVGDTITYVTYLGEGISLIKVDKFLKTVDLNTGKHKQQLEVLRSKTDQIMVNKKNIIYVFLKEYGGWVNFPEYNYQYIRQAGGKQY